MAKPPADPRLSLLPGTIRPLAEECGFEAVEKLVAAFGGTRLYVPESAVSAAIAGQAGRPIAEALRRHFGGGHVVLPRNRILQAAKRREAIRNDDRPANVIAREHGITVGAVYRMRGNRPGPSGQPAPVKKPGRPKYRDPAVMDIEEMLARK